MHLHDLTEWDAGTGARKGKVGVQVSDRRCDGGEQMRLGERRCWRVRVDRDEAGNVTDLHQ